MDAVSNVMAGKRGLVMGVANERSIAWGIAQQLKAAGAELGITYLPDEKGRFESKVRELTAPLEPSLFLPLNVQDADQIDGRDPFRGKAVPLHPPHGRRRQGAGLKPRRQAQLSHPAVEIGLDQGVVGRTDRPGRPRHQPHVLHRPFGGKSGGRRARRLGARGLGGEHGQTQGRRQSRQQQDQPHAIHPPKSLAALRTEAVAFRKSETSAPRQRLVRFRSTRLPTAPSPSSALEPKG